MEGQNLAQVQTTLYKLGGHAQKKGFSGPSIGVKEADANKEMPNKLQNYLESAHGEC